MKTRERGNFTGYEGGFPLDCETLEMLQGQIEMLELLAQVAGDKVILSGCQLDLRRNRRSPGYVVVGGEVLYWVGGNATAGLKVETKSEAVESNGEMYADAYERKWLVPAAVDDAADYSWSDFKTFTSIPGLRDEMEKQCNNFGIELRDIDEAFRTGDSALNRRIEELNEEVTELRRIIESSSAGGAVEPVGTIRTWAGSLQTLMASCGGEWLECSSERYELPYSKSDYPKLFEVLDDRYKETKQNIVGGGSNIIISTFSFRVPNIQGDDVTYYIKAKL